MKYWHQLVLELVFESAINWKHKRRLPITHKINDLGKLKYLIKLIKLFYKANVSRITQS